MKTKISLLILAAALTAAAQSPQMVDQTTPHLYTNSGVVGTYYGDNLNMAFGKVNANFTSDAAQFTTLTAGLGLLSLNFGATSNVLAAFLTTNIPGEPQFKNFLTTNTPSSGGGGSGGGAYPDLTDTAGNVGINQTAPAYTLDVNGPVNITGGPSAMNAYTRIFNDGYGTMNFESTYPGAPGGFATEFALGAGASAFHCIDGSGNSYGIIYCDSDSAKIGNDQTAQVFQVGGGGQMTVTDSSGLGFYLDGSGNFYNDTAFNSDWGSFYSDGSGNVTCTSLTQTSDLNAKTNLAAVDAAGILKRLLAVPVYRWNFRDYATTNYVVARATNAPVTNAVVRQHVLSNVTHFGPLAQDWSAGFGGRTNGISVIDMQGLLLAGLQGLASPAHTAAVAGAVYPSNTWNLAAITNAMPNFSVWQGNSNGCCLVTLSLSNGVVRCLQALR